MEEKDAQVKVKVESWQLRSTRSGMTSLEWDQLLPTTPEVSFELSMTLACSWLIVLYLHVYIVAFCTLSIDIVSSYIIA